MLNFRHCLKVTGSHTFKQYYPTSSLLLQSYSTQQSQETAAIFGAVVRGDEEALKNYLNEGYDLGIKNYDQRTPLHLASGNHQFLF